MALRKKQYVALINYHADGYKWSKFQMVWLEEPDSIPYVAGHILMPLNTAIKQGLYPPDKKTFLSNLKKSTSKSKKKTTKTTTKKTNSPSKKLLGNKLRQAVQAKKAAAAKKKSTLSADKLAAIKSGGK